MYCNTPKSSKEGNCPWSATGTFEKDSSRFFGELWGFRSLPEFYYAGHSNWKHAWTLKGFSTAKNEGLLFSKAQPVAASSPVPQTPFRRSQGSNSPSLPPWPGKSSTENSSFSPAGLREDCALQPRTTSQSSPRVKLESCSSSPSFPGSMAVLVQKPLRIALAIGQQIFRKIRC